MAEFDLCLLDCSAIQDYVFGSNKLKSNVGASQIVEEIYSEEPKGWLAQVIAEVVPAGKFVLKKWRETPEKIHLGKPGTLMETGYVGGGNALLLFRRHDGENLAKKFVQAWTRKLLLEAPGVQPVVAIQETDSLDNPAALEAVFKLLEENKNLQKAETVIPRHGITAECKVTGLSVEDYHSSGKNQKEYLSSVAAAKFEQADAANDAINEKYLTKEFDTKYKQYTFGNDLEALGQKKGEDNHIAIVHIDGNSIGEKFKACETPADKRMLADRIDDITTKAVQATLQKLRPYLPDLVDGSLQPYWNPKTQQYILPVRPIVLSGDDITFISDARLGFFLAETFMKAFTAGNLRDIAPLQKNENLAKLSCCAGIAITRTKYPFYRGYQLAEKLCRRAKKEGRESNTSWLDFHFSHSGLSFGDLETLRQRRYQVGENKLLWRPWKLGDPNNMQDFQAAKNAIHHFRTQGREGKGWPNSKLHELFHALVQGQEQTKGFLAQAKARGLTLHHIPEAGNAHETGWYSNRTPYYDILEMMDFYPESLMKEANNV